VLAPAIYLAYWWCFDSMTAAIVALDPMGVVAPEPFGLETAIAAAIAGTGGWYLAGLIHRLRQRLKKLSEWERAFDAVHSFQLSRIRVLLRSVVTDLGRHIDRVFVDLTSRRPLSPEPRTRTLPHTDDDVVDPLALAVAQRWLSEPDSPIKPQTTLFRASAGHPLLFALWGLTVSLVLVGLPRDLDTFVVYGSVAVGVAALGLMGVVLRAATPSVGVSVLALVVGLLALSVTIVIPTSFAAPVDSHWLQLMVVGWLLSVIVGTWENWARSDQERRRGSLQFAARKAETYGAKLNTLDAVNPRLIYSATLGTLISATVDLTSGDGTDDTKQRATDAIAGRIVAEFATRELGAQPLPEAQVRSIVATWDSVMGSHTVISPSVFGGMVWNPDAVEAFATEWTHFALSQAGSTPSGGDLVLTLDQEGLIVSRLGEHPQDTRMRLGGSAHSASSPGDITGQKVLQPSQAI
jgi:hypothetical protein